MGEVKAMRAALLRDVKLRKRKRAASLVGQLGRVAALKHGCSDRVQDSDQFLS